MIIQRLYLVVPISSFVLYLTLMRNPQLLFMSLTQSQLFSGLNSKIYVFSKILPQS